jgi:hypothetical protein
MSSHFITFSAKKKLIIKARIEGIYNFEPTCKKYLLRESYSKSSITGTVHNIIKDCKCSHSFILRKIDKAKGCRTTFCEVPKPLVNSKDKHHGFYQSHHRVCLTSLIMRTSLLFISINVVPNFVLCRQ